MQKVIIFSPRETLIHWFRDHKIVNVFCFPFLLKLFAEAVRAFEMAINIYTDMVGHYFV